MHGPAADSATRRRGRSAGTDKESLRGAANLADAHAREHGDGVWPGHELWLDDGATVHAAVGTYRPNPFGLHEATGNLWEWCLDG